PWRRSQFRSDAVILQKNRVEARLREFILLVVPRPISLIRRFKRARDCLQTPGGCHHRDPADLKFPEADEALNGFMPGIVADGLPAALVAVVCIRAGTRLGHSERHGSWSIKKPAAMRGANGGIRTFEWSF